MELGTKNSKVRSVGVARSVGLGSTCVLYFVHRLSLRELLTDGNCSLSRSVRAAPGSCVMDVATRNALALPRAITSKPVKEKAYEGRAVG